MGSNNSLTESDDDILNSNDGENSIIIIGVCDSWSKARLTECIKRMGFKFLGIEKKCGQAQAIIRFESLEDKKNGFRCLRGCTVSGNRWILKNFEIETLTTPYASQTEINNCSKLITQEALDRVFPFRDKDSGSRIACKLSDAKSFLKDILDKNNEIKMYPSSNVDNYCVELLVGYDKDGKIGVGYNSGSRVNAFIHTIDEKFPYPSSILEIARHFEKFVESSVFPPYDPNSDTGKWRTIVIRMTSLQEIMLIVATFGGLPLNEINRLVNDFKDITKSLYWVKADRDYYDSQSPNRVIYGTPYLTDKINGMEFSITPFSQFPHNFGTFSSIIQTIVDKAQIDQNTVLVDLCCGSGVLSISLASFVKRIVGYDISEHRINNSNKNSELNKIKNAYFVHGTSSTFLFDVANNLTQSERLVCILNTSVNGQHVELLKSIRLCPKVSCFIYLSDCPYSFAYDVQRIISNPDFTNQSEPMKLSDLELFESEPNTHSIKVLGFFN